MSNDTVMVRVSRSAHAVLRSLAEETDESMTEILDRIIESYRRAHFFAGLNNDFAALRRTRLPGRRNGKNGRRGTPRSPMDSRIDT